MCVFHPPRISFYLLVLCFVRQWSLDKWKIIKTIRLPKLTDTWYSVISQLKACAADACVRAKTVRTAVRTSAVICLTLILIYSNSINGRIIILLLTSGINTENIMSWLFGLDSCLLNSQLFLYLSSRCSTKHSGCRLNIYFLTLFSILHLSDCLAGLNSNSMREGIAGKTDSKNSPAHCVPFIGRMSEAEYTQKHCVPPNVE